VSLGETLAVIVDSAFLPIGRKYKSSNLSVSRSLRRQSRRVGKRLKKNFESRILRK
jgi:hypothetical protein